ncbi:acyl carrier protein [Sulfuricurvum sp.]|uniref:acyl carrier protein n=1 Tax=Sulfuricurvum sp. TaxID=2025608 RepID=UPI003BB578B5
MTKQDLITEIEDILQVDEGSLNEETALASLEDWDSLAFISIIALFDKKLSKKVSLDELKQCQSVGDIIALSGI